MKWNVFRCHGEHTDKQQFSKTMGVLKEYIGKNMTYPGVVTELCEESFAIPTLVEPSPISKAEYEADMNKKLKWKLGMKT
jgi:hypothetical protein